MRQLLFLFLGLGLAACGDSAGGGVGDGPIGVWDSSRGAVTDDDIDGDGVPNLDDNCPSLPNRDQGDSCRYERPVDPEGEVTVNDGLARINHYREMVGLAPAALDSGYSRACQRHLDYLVAESFQTGETVLTNEQNPESSNYSSAGAAAGRDSLLMYGPDNLVDAVDTFMNTLFHRLPLLHPGLHTVGMAQEGEYACVLYRRGTSEISAPHPLMWPAPDVLFMEKRFNGNENPCPTSDSPFENAGCPSSASIISLGLHGAGAISDVSATITNLWTMEELPVSRVYHDGGSSELETEGYVGGSIAVVPEEGTQFENAPYEVRLNAMVGGSAQEYRWRFYNSTPIMHDAGCNFFDGNSLEMPVRLSPPAGVSEGICEGSTNDFYKIIRDEGPYTVSLYYDPSVANLDLVIYGPTGDVIAEGREFFSPEVIENVPGLSTIEVRGRTRSDQALYNLSIE